MAQAAGRPQQTVRRPGRLYAGYALDLDGTIYLGETLLPGAAETVAALREAGRPVVFLSNNPLYTRADYAAKLTRLGIPTEPDSVVNSSYVLVRHLLHTAPGARLFVIGEASVREELVQAGFPLTEDPREVGIVVACFDRTFDYRKLKIAFDAIRAGARFVATNRDAYCPTPDGGLPDCGAIIAAVEACTGHPVEEVVGKPSPIMGRALAERLGVPPADALMVGDRLETDVAMGRASGMATAVVLTGVTTPEAALAADPPPDYILERLDQLLPDPPGWERW
ncbi:MAG: HAD-IIA family hydrolase [Armatimonadota bacterium]|nr:HAD-IIA family hydrolase [Armatimonadota bacterium]MDR7520015.1 HAD-IIA family hydrolase [Armatimonadota bacterium]MDR7549222.1 HAD-IIA family hydrolase [Armatimonadota bacterium]